MIRNFWMEGNVDGRSTLVSGGPKSKEGGMSIDFSIRDKGESKKALRVDCFVFKGKNIIQVFDRKKNEVIYTIETER